MRNNKERIFVKNCFDSFADESGAPVPLNPSYPPNFTISFFNLEEES
jgi:hypothetical protein